MVSKSNNLMFQFGTSSYVGINESLNKLYY